MAGAGRFKLFRDLVALTGGQFFGMLAGFLAFAYLARILEPEQYGALEYTVGLSVIFAMVIDWGLGPVGARTVIGRPGQTPEVAALIPTARLGIACVAVPVMALGAMLLGHDEQTTALVWLFALALLAAPWKQDWLLQGHDMMNAVALGHPLRMLVFVTGVVLFVNAPGDLLRVGFVEITAAAAAAAFYLLVQARWITPVRLRFSPARLRELMSQGFSVGLVNVVWALIQYLPMVVLASLVGGADPAWLGASLRIVVALLAVCVAYHFNLYPAVTQRIEQPAALESLLDASFRVTAWAGISGALTLCLLAEPIMVVTFGGDFAAAGPTLAIMIWAVPATLLSGHARWTLIAMGRQRQVLTANLAGAAAVLAVSLALVEPWRSEGAAAAVVTATLTVWAVAHYRISGRVGRALRPGAFALPLAVAACIGAAAWYLIPDVWIRGITAGLLSLVTGLAADRSLLSAFKRLADAKNPAGDKM